MNKHKLAWGIAYGAMMGLMLFSLLRPKSELIFIAPDENGSFSRTLSERNYTVVFREVDHRILQISFRPKRELWDYLLPIAMGVAMGIAVFRNPPNSREDQLVDADPRIVTDHTLYQDFVREDSDRALFSGDELVTVFASWLKRQPLTKSQKMNTTEQDGTSNGG